MNICLLTPTFLPKLGGVETVVSSLATEYLRKDHQVIVVTQQLRRKRTEKVNDNFKYPVIRYRRPWSFRINPGLASIRQALLCAHRQLKFDVIHCHMAFPVGPVALQLSAKLNCPVVITTHGSDIRPDSRYRRKTMIWRQILRSLRNADRLTAICETMETLLQQLAPGRPILRIPNGVDVKDLNRPPQPDADSDNRQELQDNPFALALGGLTTKKGFDLLIESFNNCRDQLGDLHLALAGDGPQRANLQMMIQRFALQDRLHMVGRVYGSQKRWLLQNCRFVVMPSRTEAFPLVALEALACGKPLLASRVGALGDLIEDNVTGLLIEPQNVGELATALIRLAEKSLQEKLAANTRKIAVQYDWSDIADRYVQVYRQLV